MEHLTTIRKFTIWVQIALFTLLLANSILFRHLHKIGNGGIISHAHPYEHSNDSPVQDHHHSGGELWLLDLVSNGIYRAGEWNVTITEVMFGQTVITSEKKPEVHYQAIFLSAASLRGPPALIANLL